MSILTCWSLFSALAEPPASLQIQKVERFEFLYWDGQQGENLLTEEKLKEKPEQAPENPQWAAIYGDFAFYYNSPSRAEELGEGGNVLGYTKSSMIIVSSEGVLRVMPDLLAVLGVEKISLEDVRKLEPQERQYLLALIVENQLADIKPAECLVP